MKTKLKKAEERAILCECAMLNDKDLEKKYYRLIWATDGTEVEEMCKRHYDTIDIKEQEYYEQTMDLKIKLLEEVCRKRGIKLWDNNKDDDK